MYNVSSLFSNYTVQNLTHYSQYRVEVRACHDDNAYDPENPWLVQGSLALLMLLKSLLCRMHLFIRWVPFCLLGRKPDTKDVLCQLLHLPGQRE